MEIEYISMHIDEKKWIDISQQKPNPNINKIIWVKLEGDNIHLASVIANEKETLPDKIFPIIFDIKKNRLLNVERSIDKKISMWQEIDVKKW